MAYTITQGPELSFGNRRARFVTVDITSYTNDGESITPALLGFGSVDGVVPFSMEKGYMFRWDKTNNKLLAYTDATTQAGAVDLGEIGLLVVGV